MKHFTLTQRSVPIIAVIIIGCLGPNLPAHADTTSIPITQTVSPGLLHLTPSTYVTLSNVVLDHTRGQTSNGDIGPVLIDDSRGNYAGWSATATIGDLVSISSFANDNNDPSPFTVTGSYTGTSDAEITLSTGSGANGTHLGSMSYTVGGAMVSGSGVLQANQSLGTTGLSFSAADIEYPKWVDYHLHIHLIQATNFTVTPNPTTALSGSDLFITTGGRHTLAGPNDPVTIATAPKGYGDGYYSANAALKLAIPAGTHSGTYTGQIVETIN